jgi:hypothetical protein
MKTKEINAKEIKEIRMKKTKPKKPRKPQTGLIHYNILCKDKEEREELQNLIWMLKYRMYEKRGSTALLKLLAITRSLMLRAHAMQSPCQPQARRTW